MLQQSGLSDAGLAAQDQHAAAPSPRVLKQPAQYSELISPTAQHRDLGSGAGAGHGHNSAPMNG
jgi:hypothetical protein